MSHILLKKAKVLVGAISWGRLLDLLNEHVDGVNSCPQTPASQIVDSHLLVRHSWLYL